MAAPKNKRKRMVLILIVVLAVLHIAYFFVMQAQHEHEDELLAYALMSSDYAFSVKKDDIVKVSWVNHENEGKTLVKDGDTWYFENDRDFPLSQDAVNSLLNVVSTIPAQHVISDVQDLEQYGLDPVMQDVYITTADGSESHLCIGNYNQYRSIYYLMRPEDTSTVYTIAALLAASINKQTGEWVQDASLPYFSLLEEVTVTAPDGHTVKLVCESGETADDEKWYVQEGDALIQQDTATVQTFTQMLQTFDWNEIVCYLPENTDETIDMSNPYTIRVKYIDGSNNNAEGECMICLSEDGKFGMQDDCPLVYTLDSDLRIAWHSLGL